jgi:hypothetical protein
LAVCSGQLAVSKDFGQIGISIFKVIPKGWHYYSKALKGGKNPEGVTLAISASVWSPDQRLRKNTTNVTPSGFK